MCDWKGNVNRIENSDNQSHDNLCNSVVHVIFFRVTSAFIISTLNVISI